MGHAQAQEAIPVILFVLHERWWKEMFDILASIFDHIGWSFQDGLDVDIWK